MYEYETKIEMQIDNELAETEKKAKKPDIEWFFNTPYTAYCGKCGRMIITGGVKPINLIECPWCETPINWTGWNHR